jgi:ribosomal protein S18 acetylase RimI-like enzyme
MVAFTHFRFLVEDHCTVLYCYELQVRQDRARLGLGKRLMTLLEIIARKHKMQYVMLTVLLVNNDACEFYKRIGYGVDGTSPQMDLDTDGKDVPYEILSKRLF